MGHKNDIMNISVIASQPQYWTSHHHLTCIEAKAAVFKKARPEFKLYINSYQDL